MIVRRLKRIEIDDSKWDKCIALSPIDHVYAHTWYLDIVAPEWQALVLGDYEAVMPLAVKHKYFATYITHPRFTQQLGIFAADPLDNETIRKFFYSLPYFFSQIQVNMQSAPDCKRFNSFQLPNYELDLGFSYDVLSANFSNNANRNINKSEQNIVVRNHDSIPFFMDFLQLYARFDFDNFFKRDLHSLISKSIQLGNGWISGAFDQKGNCLALIFFVRSSNRIVYHTSICSADGYALGAPFGIVNLIIKKYAGQSCVLDFEGSAIEGIARFFKGFGAVYRHYYLVKMNKCRLLNSPKVFRSFLWSS